MSFPSASRLSKLGPTNERTSLMSSRKYYDSIPESERKPSDPDSQLVRDVLNAQNASKERGEKEPKGASLKDFALLAKEEKGMIITGTIALLISSVTLIAIPYLVGRIIDTTTKTENDEESQNEAKKNLFKVVLYLFAIISTSAVFATIRSYFFTIAGERVVARLRKQLFASIVTQEVAFFDENKTGELLNRLASDCTILQNTVTVNVSMALRGFINFFSSVFMLFYTSWKLSLISLSLLPLIIGASFVYGKTIKHISKSFQDALASASDNATEAITNIRTVKSFSHEEGEMHSYAKKINITLEWAKKKGVAGGIFAGIIVFLANISVCGILYYGGVLVITQQISPGSLTSFIIYTLTVATGMGTLTALYGDFMNAVGASERVFEILRRTPKVKWREGEYLPSVQGHMKLEEVSFSYPSRPDVSVLDKISLELKPGNIVALVGPSGQGKSTIVSLLEMFYYPTSGAITLDGHNIKDLDPRYLRSKIGLVSQEPTLFGCSIAENISYGLVASDERIEEVAKLANAHEFISKFPDGYKTMVGERGIKLSGGQKQRIAIARALLKDPTILLLDEATSALDSESEHLVKQALEVLMRGRTVLVVAHRLSTVQNAQVVCVVDGGKIIEQGTHEELLANPVGLYQRLVKRQLQSS